MFFTLTPFWMQLKLKNEFLMPHIYNEPTWWNCVILTFHSGINFFTVSWSFVPGGQTCCINNCTATIRFQAHLVHTHSYTHPHTHCIHVQCTAYPFDRQQNLYLFFRNSATKFCYQGNNRTTKSLFFNLNNVPTRSMECANKNVPFHYIISIKSWRQKGSQNS